MTIRVGFTGTQGGMTGAQQITLRNVLPRKGELHHGDCIGSDAEAHDIAEEVGMEPVIHPPSNPSKRAWKKANRIGKPLPYLVRNKIIVTETDELIAAPGEFEEQLRSGTWSTVRYAEKMRKPVRVIFPDGTIGLRGHE